MGIYSKYEHDISPDGLHRFRNLVNEDRSSPVLDVGEGIGFFCAGDRRPPLPLFVERRVTYRRQLDQHSNTMEVRRDFELRLVMGDAATSWEPIPKNTKDSPAFESDTLRHDGLTYFLLGSKMYVCRDGESLGTVEYVKTVVVNDQGIRNRFRYSVTLELLRRAIVVVYRGEVPCGTKPYDREAWLQARLDSRYEVFD